jgi:hypothetical protein
MKQVVGLMSAVAVLSMSVLSAGAAPLNSPELQAVKVSDRSVPLCCPGRAGWLCSYEPLHSG